MAGRAMTGPRLPYVVTKLEGEIEVTKYRVEKDEQTGAYIGIESHTETEDAGYLAFFPNGNYMRIRNKEELKRYGLDKKPRLIADDGAIDPRFAPDEAFENLEAKVVNHVKRVCGPIVVTGYDGEINLPTLKEDSYVA